jgi:4-amino-4-deoxy-L-arabinose transferase-like glycosyltransferase
MPKERLERLLTAFAIFCLALGIRLIGLGDQSFSPAELFSLDAWTNDATRIGSGFFNDKALSIFYLAAWLWRLVGGEAQCWMRLLPALCSAFGAVVLYLIVERKITRTTAVLSVLFYCLHPFLIIHAQDLSPISMAMLFILLSVWYATKWLASHGEQGKFGMTAFAILAIYTHPAAWLLVLFLALAALSTRLEPGFLRKYSYSPIVAILIFGLPSALNIFNRLAQGEIPINLLGRSDLINQMNLLFSFCGAYVVLGIDHLPFIFTMIAIAVMVIVAMTSLVFCLWGGWRHPFLGFLFFIPIIGAVLVNQITDTVIIDSILPFMLFGLACVAAGVGELSNQKPIWKIAAGFTALLFISFSIVAFFNYRSTVYVHKTYWETACSFARQSDDFRILTYSNQVARDLKKEKIGKCHFTALLHNDEKISPEIAQRVLRQVGNSERVILLDYYREKFDPGRTTIKTLARKFGEPVSYDLPGPGNARILVYTKQVDAPGPNLFWYGSWPKSPRLPYLRSATQ